MKYEQAYKSEGFGDPLYIGVDLKVASPVGVTEGVRLAAYKAAALLEDAVTRDFYANDKEAQKRAAEERQLLLACFGPAPIYAEPIPNGYCHRACCEHRPWFKVATPIGYVRIGWRKRVIVVDWSEAPLVLSTAEKLFPGEETTKDGRMIHAWSYEKTREYIAALFAEANITS